MITWMQRHKKWLIITIWISTIAFIGAGFVGWGQYSYGDKAGAIAKVGDVEITQGEFQKEYSRLYQQYNQMFQGNFDKEKAKQFGLQKQALQKLEQEALLVNLADEYELSVSNEEVVEVLKQNPAFFKNGKFDKETYKQILAQNRMTIVEFEKSLKKQIRIQKLLTLLRVKASKNEAKIVDTVLSIADKIEYKVLTPQAIHVDVNETELKQFWEGMKNSFLTEVSYEIRFIKQKPVVEQPEQAKVEEYYAKNKFHFKDKDGKILPLQQVETEVVDALNKEATKKEALKTYVALKNNKIDTNTTKVQTATISASNNPFNQAVLDAVAHTDPQKPYLKPIDVEGVYYVFELVRIIPAAPKSFEEARAEVLPLYLEQKKQEKIMQLAKESLPHFKGKVSDFITMQTHTPLEGLSFTQTKSFLQKLFTSQNKRSYVVLDDGKIVLYNILEQKLLKTTNNDTQNVIEKLKTDIFSEGLLKSLQKRYVTEIYIQGL